MKMCTFIPKFEGLRDKLPKCKTYAISLTLTTVQKEFLGRGNWKLNQIVAWWFGSYLDTVFEKITEEEKSKRRMDLDTDESQKVRKSTRIQSDLLILLNEQVDSLNKSNPKDWWSKTKLVRVIIENYMIIKK